MLLFADGFDHFSSDEVHKKWDEWTPSSWTGICEISESAGRFGSHGVHFNDSWRWFKKIIPTRSTLVMGLAFNPTAGMSAVPLYLFQVYYGTYMLAGLRISQNHYIQILSGGDYENAVVQAQSTLTVKTGVFQYIEFKVYIHPSAGWAIARMNEVQACSASNIDTGAVYDGQVCTVADSVRMLGKTTWQRIDCSGSNYVDDFYLCDTLGSSCNDFLGDVTMEEHLPIADGYYQQWTRSAPYAGFTLVDDAWDAVDTDTYVYSNTPNVKDTYNFPNLSIQVGTVYAVAINYYAQKVDSGARHIKGLGRLYGQDYLGQDINLNWLYGFYQNIFHDAPGYCGWTVSQVNAAEFGQRLES